LAVLERLVELELLVEREAYNLEDIVALELEVRHILVVEGIMVVDIDHLNILVVELEHLNILVVELEHLNILVVEVEYLQYFDLCMIVGYLLMDFLFFLLFMVILFFILTVWLIRHFFCLNF
jgi:hypothetical protein